MSLADRLRMRPRSHARVSKGPGKALGVHWMAELGERVGMTPRCTTGHELDVRQRLTLSGEVIETTEETSHVGADAAGR